MDAKLLYWTAAFVNMGVIIGLAAAGVRRIRRGDVVHHRRFMLGAAGLVGAFLLSYPVKLLLLGRENLGVWGENSVAVLRIHEIFVLGMVLAGGTALRKIWRSRQLSSLPAPAGPERLPAFRSHRRAGWVAVVGAVLGFLTAGLVLRGMIERGPAPAVSVPSNAGELERS